MEIKPDTEIFKDHYLVAGHSVFNGDIVYKSVFSNRDSVKEFLKGTTGGNVNNIKFFVYRIKEIEYDG